MGPSPIESYEKSGGSMSAGLPARQLGRAFLSELQSSRTSISCTSIEKDSLSKETGEFISPTYTMYSSSQSSCNALPVLAFAFLFLSISVTSLPSLPLCTRLLYQFPDPTWVENLAVRSNGEILVTLQTTPDVYLIDPSGKQTPTLVHSFQSLLGLGAITELEDDVFYVAGGNLTVVPLKHAPGTYAVWELDMRNFSHSGAQVRKVTDIPEAGFLDGGATLSKVDKTILLGDALLGVVWKVNVHSGAYSVVISDPTMNPLPDAFFEVGIDGLKIHDRYMYFTNDNQGLVCRVPIWTNGTATGSVEVLADLGTGKGLDDMTVDRQGRVWIAENPVNLISVLLRNGTLVDVVGATDQLTVAGVTACLFGREKATKNTLYCTTCGGLAGPVNGTVTEGGKIVAIDTQGF